MLRIEAWLRGDLSGTYKDGGANSWVRNYVLEQAGYKCEICGWAEVNPFTGLVVLAVDHIDGDRWNNRRENLKVLCLNHHGLTTTFGYLNSKYMREKRGVYNVSLS